MPEIVRDTHEYFETLDERFVMEEARGVSALLQFDLRPDEVDEGGQWYVRVEGGRLIEIMPGRIDRPTLTLAMDATNFVRMTNGDLDGIHAYMIRKLRVQGNVAVATRMKQFLPPREPLAHQGAA